jgi:hypothetical protein
MKILSLAAISALLLFTSCGKTTASATSATTTGYPEVSVKCGTEACVK